MEPRNAYLRSKLQHAQQAIDGQIARLSLTMALETAKKKLARDKQQAEQKKQNSLSSLQNELQSFYTQFPLVNRGDRIDNSLLDKNKNNRRNNGTTQ